MSYTQFFTTSFGARIAYASSGSGPPVMYLPPLLSHLRLMGDEPSFRAFNEALSSDFTVIRYDRYGCGYSDRDRTDFSSDLDLRVLTELIDHFRLEQVALLGFSNGGPTAIQYAVARPQHVSHLLLLGVNWTAGKPSPTRVALHQLMRADWRIGSNAIVDYLLPSGNPEARAWLARFHREATSAEVAIRLAEASAESDVSHLLPRLTVPTLVMHRRDDRLVSLESARDLAARVPGAQFVTLPGDAHIAEFGDIEPLVQAIRAFVRAPASYNPPVPQGLSKRESEVLDLISTGLTNREIVERHTVNIYTKLGVRGRAAATAWALQHATGQSGNST